MLRGQLEGAGFTAYAEPTAADGQVGRAGTVIGHCTAADPPVVVDEGVALTKVNGGNGHWTRTRLDGDRHGKAEVQFARRLGRRAAWTISVARAPDFADER